MDLEARLSVMLCGDMVECKVDELRDWDAAIWKRAGKLMCKILN